MLDLIIPAGTIPNEVVEKMMPGHLFLVRLHSDVQALHVVQVESLEVERTAGSKTFRIQCSLVSTERSTLSALDPNNEVQGIGHA